MGDRVLVTGGAGFIGGHLVERLLVDGFAVRVLDDVSTGQMSNLDAVADDIELIKADIRDAEQCCRAADGARWIFHQAAMGSVPRSVKEPVTSTQVNVMGTLNVLESARACGAERLIFAASSSAYGDTETLPKTETMVPRPLSPYAASKVACEHYCCAYWYSYSLPTVCLRYFNVFGPRQRPDGPYAAVIPRFFDMLSRDQRPTIFGDGQQTRDFTFVANALEANMLAAAAPKEAFGRVFNVATGVGISIRKLHDTVADLLGKELEPILAEPRAGDIRHSRADISLARSVLRYEPRIDLAEGLARMAATLAVGA